MSTKLGRMASARATPSRRSSPCASEPAGASAWAVEAEQRQQLVGAPARLARARAHAERGDLDVLAHREVAERLASAGTCARAPSAPRRCGLQPVISRPSSSIVPDVGRSKPVMRLTSVDLPAPFGPIRPTTSCCRSSSVTSSTACTPSNERETESARSVPCGAGLSAGWLRAGSSFRHGTAVAPDGARDHRGSCHVAQIFGTTLAVTEPTTCSLLPWILITRYWRPNTRVQRRREADEARERRHLA